MGIEKQKTLEEYKLELKSLTKNECYEWMYQMSKQLCDIGDILDNFDGTETEIIRAIKKVMNIDE